MRVLRWVAPMALVVAASGCSLSGLMGGGAKAPPTLLTLTSEAADPVTMTRTGAPGQAVTINVPVIGKSLRTTRIPVQLTPTDVQYVTNAEWVDTPDRLFQELLSETVRRTTNRIVLSGKQTALDPGLLVTGELQRFGYDASTGQAIVQYDVALSTEGGARVESRRFTATVPSDGTATSIGPALNRAANQVATEVARWIGG